MSEIKTCADCKEYRDCFDDEYCGWCNCARCVYSVMNKYCTLRSKDNFEPKESEDANGQDK